jgi:hypothetical protein
MMNRRGLWLGCENNIKVDTEDKEDIEYIGMALTGLMLFEIGLDS